MVSQSSVNEFQEVISIFFCQRVSGGYLNLLSLSLKAKYPKETAPPMAAAGLLGPDLVHASRRTNSLISFFRAIRHETWPCSFSTFSWPPCSISLLEFRWPSSRRMVSIRTQAIWGTGPDCGGPWRTSRCALGWTSITCEGTPTIGSRWGTIPTLNWCGEVSKVM